MDKTSMAFTVNETGIIVPLEQASSLRIYDLQSGQWCISREWGMGDLRITFSESISDAVRAIAAYLQGCLTLVAGELSGPVREEFERSGIEVWELRGEPTELAEVIQLEAA